MRGGCGAGVRRRGTDQATAGPTSFHCAGVSGRARWSLRPREGWWWRRSGGARWSLRPREGWWWKRRQRWDHKGCWFWVDELWLVRIDEVHKALQEQVHLAYERAVVAVVPQEHVELHAAMGADHVEGSIGMTPLLAESEVLGQLAASRVGFPVRRGEVIGLERAEPLPDVHVRFPPRSLVRPDSAMRTPRPFGWYFVHLVLQALQDVPGVW